MGLYSLITSFRNWCFDKGVLREHRYATPIIGVGNLAVGGTGETPHVEYIARLLAGRRVAVVSRGYGRKTHGFLRVEQHSTADEVGDEPLCLKLQHPELDVCVCEKRVEAMEILLSGEQPTPDVVILDDNFQHRYVRAGLQLLLTDYSRLYVSDRVMPYGRLREVPSGAERADVVIVTKCPSALSPAGAQSIVARLRLAPHQKVFFTTLGYAPLRPLFGGPAFSAPASKLLLITGIARPEPLLQYLSSSPLTTEGGVANFLRFSDHHRFSARDIERIVSAGVEADAIVTTSKDAVRLLQHEHAFPDNMRRKLYVQDIAVEFLFGGEQAFSEIVLNEMARYTK